MHFLIFLVSEMADVHFTPDCVSPSHLFHCNHLVCLMFHLLQALRRRRRKMERIQQQKGLNSVSSALILYAVYLRSFSLLDRG